MPINPAIALSVKPLEIQQRDPLQEYAQITQIQNAMLQNQLARQQVEQEQGVMNYLRGAGNLTTPEGRAGLRQFGKTGLAYEKLLSEQETAALKRQELEGKLRDQRMAALGTGLTSVMNDPSDESLKSAFDRLDATGVDTRVHRQALLAEPDLMKRQAIIKNYVSSNPEGRQALAFVQPKPEKFDLDGKVVVMDMNPNSPTYKQQIQEFGKGISPSTAARLAFDKEKFAWEKANPGYEIKDTDTGYVAVNKRNPADVRPVTMGAAPSAIPTTTPGAAPGAALGAAPTALTGAAPQQVQSGKGLTEAQSKAVGFAARAKEADAILNTVKASPTAVALKQGLESTIGIGGVLGAGANVALSPAAQQVDQAQRNFVNAVLRQESGAAISQSEFENARKQYFAQPGDSQKVIEQKAKNRATVIRSLETVAGPGMRKAAGAGPAADPLGIR